MSMRMLNPAIQRAIIVGANVPGTTRAQRRAIRRAARSSNPKIQQFCELAPGGMNANFQIVMPFAYDAGCRVFGSNCECPPGWLRAQQKWDDWWPICCPPTCVSCPDESAPDGYQSTGLKFRPAGEEEKWGFGKFASSDDICCPSPQQPPAERCPPGYRWEDTPNGWVCIPEKKPSWWQRPHQPVAPAPSGGGARPQPSRARFVAATRRRT